jgi:hypothetical protein
LLVVVCEFKAALLSSIFDVQADSMQQLNIKIHPISILFLDFIISLPLCSVILY